MDGVSSRTKRDTQYKSPRTTMPGRRFCATIVSPNSSLEITCLPDVILTGEHAMEYVPEEYHPTIYTKRAFTFSNALFGNRLLTLVNPARSSKLPLRGRSEGSCPSRLRRDEISSHPVENRMGRKPFTTCRSGGIWTHDPLNPIQVRYRAAPRSVVLYPVP